LFFFVNGRILKFLIDSRSIDLGFCRSAAKMDDDLVQEEEQQQQKVSKDFIAGVAAGAMGVVVGHPFDTVKVRVQTAMHSSAWQSFRATTRQEGIRGLFKGMMTPLMTDALCTSVVFGSYGMAVQKLFPNVVDRERLSFVQAYAGGALAGVAAAFVLCPVELVKIRLQVQVDGGGGGRQATRLFASPLDVVVRTVRADGIRGLFRGLPATLLRDVPSFGVYFASYAWLRREFHRDEYMSMGAASLFAGGLSGCATWLCTYPMDVLKTRISEQHGLDPASRAARYTSTLDCARQCLRNEGAAGFFRGLTPTLIRSLPVNASIFGAFELAMHLLERFD
jgi:solute carrier family 25 (mitochondrial carnitine/acylcarnitine transporter), member 20/29